MKAAVQKLIISNISHCNVGNSNTLFKSLKVVLVFLSSAKSKELLSVQIIQIVFIVDSPLTLDF